MDSMQPDFSNPLMTKFSYTVTNSGPSNPVL